MKAHRIIEEALRAEGLGETILAAPPLTVETLDNHIYFYTEINSDRALAAIRQIRELDNDLQLERMRRCLPAHFPMIPIWLHIQSPGGWVDSSFSLVDAITQSVSPVYTIVEGVAASGASLVSMAGKRRYITSHSVIMVHEASTFFWGKGSAMKDEMKLMDDIKEMMIDFYVTHSLMEKTEAAALMDRRDTWFTPAEAIDKGMVDEVLS